MAQSVFACYMHNEKSYPNPPVKMHKHKHLVYAGVPKGSLLRGEGSLYIAPLRPQEQNYFLTPGSSCISKCVMSAAEGALTLHSA